MGTVDEARAVPVTAVAETLRVSTRTVWRLLARGDLDRVKVGAATRVTTASVIRLVTPPAR